MSRDFVNAFCATLPGAEWSEPFGPGTDVWKVGGKIFAAAGEGSDGVSVKCADTQTAALIIEMGHGVRAPYFHKSWVKVMWDQVPEAEFRERIGTSYDLIRATLPKKAQAAFPPRK